MKKRFKLAVLTVVGLSTMAQADIYDDYKLLANGIVINATKIENMEKSNKANLHMQTQMNVALSKELEETKGQLNAVKGILANSNTIGTGDINIFDDATRSKLSEISLGNSKMKKINKK